MSDDVELSDNHLVLAGDEFDIPVIRYLLATAHPDAYGQVFIEVPTRSFPRDVDAPDGVTVTWLARDAIHSEYANGLGAVPGEALTRAISGWVAEWIPGESHEHGACPDMRLGCSASARVKALYQHLGFDGDTGHSCR